MKQDEIDKKSVYLMGIREGDRAKSGVTRSHIKKAQIERMLYGDNA
jgi:hypothetical protein